LAKYSFKPEECRIAAENGKERVKTALTSTKGWKKEKEKIETDVHASIIMKFINEAGEWVFN
jgi:hypothetical protein